MNQLSGQFVNKNIFVNLHLITDSALYASDYCLIVLQTQERSLQGAEAFIKYIQNEVINTFNAPTLEVLGILPVLLKNNAPVDNSTLESAYEIFGKENIFKTIIKNMERLKRYDVTGVTFNDQFDKKVQLVYSEVVNEINWIKNTFSLTTAKTDFMVISRPSKTRSMCTYTSSKMTLC